MRILLILCLAFFLSITVNAQNREVGLFGGATLFSGDVIENVVDFDEINIGVGVFYRAYINPKFSFKFGLNAGKFTGNDANSSTLASRGYSFETKLLDFTAITEWNLMKLNIYGATSKIQNNFSPFLLLGVGASYFEPTVTRGNTNRDMDPYDQDQEYPKLSMVVPMGFGVKYMTSKVTIALEGSVRAGLSDLLDGISKSGDPDDNDWYGFYGLSAAYRIGGSTSGSVAPRNLEEESTSEYYDLDKEENMDDTDN